MSNNIGSQGKDRRKRRDSRKFKLPSRKCIIIRIHKKILKPLKEKIILRRNKVNRNYQYNKRSQNPRRKS